MPAMCVRGESGSALPYQKVFVVKLKRSLTNSGVGFLCLPRI